MLRSPTPVISSKTFLTVLGISACAHAVSSPDDAMRSYARSLDEGRLEDAWALSSSLDHDRFLERYADPEARRRRAEEVRGAADGLRPLGLLHDLKSDTWRVVEAAPVAAPPNDAHEAEAAVEHFLASVQAGDFDAVFAELGSSWRARYTPQRLEADFQSEPAVAGRLARIRAALPGRWELTPEGPQLPLGEGKRLKLRREGDGLKVVALE